MLKQACLNTYPRHSPTIEGDGARWMVCFYTVEAALCVLTTHRLAYLTIQTVLASLPAGAAQHHQKLPALFPWHFPVIT